MNNRKYKEKIINGLKYLEGKKINNSAEGNLSIRSKNGFYISPSGLTPKEMKYEDIAFVDFNGNFVGSSKPSSEWKMHLSIYKKKNINVIVHSHSIWASSLSCLRKKIPSFHYMVAEFGGGDIKCSKYATFGSDKIAKNVSLALENRKGCLISNHGQITVGNTIEEAISLCESMEKLSMQYLISKISGGPKLLNKKQMNEVIKLFIEYKSKH